MRSEGLGGLAVATRSAAKHRHWHIQRRPEARDSVKLSKDVTRALNHILNW